MDLFLLRVQLLFELISSLKGRSLIGRKAETKAGNTRGVGHGEFSDICERNDTGKQGYSPSGRLFFREREGRPEGRVCLTSCSKEEVVSPLLEIS